MATASARFDLITALIKWVVNTVVLFIIVKTVKGLNVSAPGFNGFLIMAAAVAVIGLLNTFIRPLIILLTLPINVLSFGIFTLVINAVMFFATGWLVKGFEVKSFWGALIGSFLFSVLTMITGMFIKPRAEAQGGIKAEYKVIDK
jgi:putative membrane protein